MFYLGSICFPFFIQSLNWALFPSCYLVDSAVMLFMYWIANFVVPEFVMKDLQADEANKDAKEEDRINEQGSTPTRTKEKGFGRTRE